MPVKTPTLGYASRTEAAHALKAKGLTNAAISEKIGVSQNAVSGLLHKSGAQTRSAAKPDQTALARGENIMLRHEVEKTVHRSTVSAAVRLVELKVPEGQFARLVDLARKAGRTPSAYAGDLFQAAYTARCQPTGDAALDAEVARLGTPQAASGPALDILQAELERTRKALARADARIAEMADEIEALSAGEAVSVDAATMEELAALRGTAAAHAEAAATWKAQAMEREKDWCDACAERDIARREVAEHKRQLETALAGQQDAERRAASFADQVDAEGRVAALKNRDDTRSHATADVSEEAKPPGHKDMVERAKGNPRDASGALSPAFVRSCVGFAAVGQTPAWIARTMRADIAHVHAALERRR